MKTLAITLLAAVLAACAGQPPEPSYYLLRADRSDGSRALQPSQDYTLGSVAIAPYIDQRGLLLETQAGEIRPARQHLWAEPIYEAVRIFLLAEVSRVRGEDLLPASLQHSGTRIEVRIDQLHGTQDGQAVLSAYWWLVDEGDIVAAYHFSEQAALAEDGYAALARAEQALLADFAARIADSLDPPAR